MDMIVVKNTQYLHGAVDTMYVSHKKGTKLVNKYSKKWTEVGCTSRLDFMLSVSGELFFPHVIIFFKHIMFARCSIV